MKPVCRISHPQIESGRCPWCSVAVDGNELVSSANETVWNLPVMSTDLDSPDDGVRSITLSNLFRTGLNTDALVPLLSNAVHDPSPHIRNIATNLTSQLGADLATDVAEELEARLSASEHGLTIRILLLGYYLLRAYQSEAVNAARVEHIFWVIRHAPESFCAGSPYVSIHAATGSTAYTTAKNIWLDQVQANPDQTTILGNAAQFFLLHDRELSEDLLERASRLEPNNAEWHNRLGQLLTLHSRCHGPTHEIDVERAFRERQIAAHLPNRSRGETARISPIQRIVGLIDLARSAFDAGHFEEAHKYATELLAATNSIEGSAGNFLHGNAIHHGNLVLGRLALRGGELLRAKEFLLAAGRTSGSPQLNSFGPNMALAKELLERGEREVVLEYFELCRIFWATHDQTLTDWMNQVNTGQIPNFRANLAY